MKRTPQNRGRKYGIDRAKELGYRPTTGSGNTKTDKGDARSHEGIFLIEFKYTDSDTYKFTLKEWEKHEEHSLRYGKDPVFLINFKNQLEVAVMSSRVWIPYTGHPPPKEIPLKSRGSKSFSIKQDAVSFRIDYFPFSVASFIIDKEKFIVIDGVDFEVIKNKYEGH